MGESNTIKRILFFIIKYLLIGLIISAAVLILCYFIGRTKSVFISNVLTYAGAGILAVGAFGIAGTQKTVGDLYHYQNVRTVGHTDSSSRLKQDFDLVNGAYVFLIKALIVSAVPFALSVIIF